MNALKKILSSILLVMLLVALSVPAFAEGTPAMSDEAAITVAGEEADASTTSAKAIGAGIAIALSASAGAIAMGLSISKAVDSIARQPEAEGGIRTALMLGLVFVETAIIYALIIAILIIFVL